MRLIEAQFDVCTPGHLSTVLGAFCHLFPSLSGLPGCDLYEWAEAVVALHPEDGAEAGQRIHDALAEASCEGEWPGKVEAVFSMSPDGDIEVRAIHVVPYVGDRILTMYPHGGGRYCVVADYTSRPSEVAAGKIIELSQRAKRWWTDDPSLPRLWNEPRYEND